MIWHSSEIDSVLEELKVDRNNGLANGVAYERLDKYGKNQVLDIKPVSLFKRFLNQINKKSVYALVLISIVCLFVSIIYSENDYYSPLLIIAILAINAFVTAYHQYTCDKVFISQKAINVPKAKVIREGIERSIPSTELVPGDIILLNEGDYISADARLIETNSFRCSELTISGDSIPVEKDASIVFEDMIPIAGRRNMVFSGCSVIHGSAKAVVVETGLNTEFGKSSEIDEQTGVKTSVIEKRINTTGRIINIVVICICVFVFLVSMAIALFSSRPFASVTVKMLLNSVALGVCALPECLPFITVIVTALGISRLVSEGILIKNTSMIESLGKTTVLCADKTGIFTKNHMEVKCIYDGDDLISLNDAEIPSKSAALLRLATACSMLQDDYTESAIEDACIKYNSQNKEDVNNVYPRLASIPFDGERKTMTSINIIDGKPLAIVKGAPEIVLKKCVGLDTNAVNNVCDKLAGSALRLICIAIKALEDSPANPVADDIERDLKFAGIIGLEDPPRYDVSDSILECKNAGIKVIMLTGDSAITASAVAKNIGMLDDDSNVITGDKLDELSDEKLAENVNSYSVFARISPAQKLRIINAFKNNGNIVTVTGSSIDDAEVLSIADVGFMVGKSDNDVAIGNSDIVVKKNSFSTVVRAIKECRGLFDNIRKAIHYLFSCNVAEILIYTLGLLIFRMPPLSAVQLLWINLLTDSFPAVSLTLQPADDGVMHNPPSTINGKLFDSNLSLKIACESIVITLCALIAFFIGNIYGRTVAYTMIFLTMTISQILHSFNLRSSNSLMDMRFKHNEFMVISNFVLIFIASFLCLTPAGFIFGFKILTSTQFIISLVLSFVIVPFCEIFKFFERKSVYNKQVL